MKRYHVVTMLAIVSLIACTTKEKKTENADTEMAPSDDTPVVQLTEAQKAEGWKPLFDGKTMNGWRFFKNKENNSWEVKDGTLHCKPFEEADKRADIMTVDQYKDFELAFDWKISYQGNSGVMFHVTEDYDEPYFTGPEYQLLDDGGYPGEVKEVNFSGGNYDMQAPVNKKLNPVGEWNSSRIVVKGPHVEHWLNDVKVVEYEIGSDDWKKRKNGSKWKDMEAYGVPTTGYIDLQDHTHEVWFKNILIKVL